MGSQRLGKAWAAGMAFILVTGTLRGQEPPKPSDAEALIGILEGGGYEERQEAVRKLEELGEAARPALEKALSGDRWLEARLAAARLLENLRRGWIALDVRDVHGNPMAEVAVVLSIRDLRCPEDPPAGKHHRVVTDAQGRAAVRGLQPGPYNIFPAWENVFTERDPPRPYAFHIRRGENRVLYVVHRGARLDGQARAAEGGENQVTQPLRIPPRTEAYGALRLGVVGPDGTPLRKAAVHLEAVRFPEPEGETRAFLPWQDRLPGAQCGIGWWPSESDGEGWVELKELRAGKYWVTVRSKGLPPVMMQDVDIVAGETSRIVAPRPLPGAIVRGRVLYPPDCREKWVSILALPVDYPLTGRLLRQALSGEPLSMLEAQLRHGDPPQGNPARETGEYCLGNLAPGPYLLLVSLSTGQLGVVYGLHLEAGKTTRLPDLKLPGSDQPDRVPLVIQGRALTQFGYPPSRCRVFLEGGGPRADTPCDAEGRFKFELSRRHLARGLSVLKFRCEGYQPCLVDLSQPHLDLGDLQVRLELQTYGRVRVRAQDAGGRPVQNVLVAPGRADSGRFPDLQRLQMTDAQGEAVLSGLACGRRSFVVYQEGHYLDGPAEVEVRPHEEARLVLTLRPGLSLKGRVSLPPGLHTSQVVVYLTGTQPWPGTCPLCWTAGIDAEGRFEIKGLSPGPVTVEARAAGFLCPKPVEAEVKEGQPEVLLELAPAGGLRVELGALYAGACLRLVPPATWRLPPRHKHSPVTTASSCADSSGRADLHGAPVGAYDLLIDPPGEPPPDLAQASIVCPGVVVRPLPSVPRPSEKIGPLRLALGPADATVIGRIVLRDEKARVLQDLGNLDAGVAAEMSTGGLRSVGCFGRLLVKLVGERATAEVRFTSGQLDPQRAPITVGEAPAGLGVPRRGQFRISGLPPGQYELHLVPDGAFGPPDQTAEQGRDPSKAAPAPLLTFKLGTGQTLDVGEIPFTISEAMMSAARDWLRGELFEVLGNGVGLDEQPER